MGIWRHINDIELQRLKEACRAKQRCNDEPAELERVYQETNTKLYVVKRDIQEYEELAVAHAVGERVGDLPPPPPQTESELRLLLNGLNRRIQEKRQEIEVSRRRYKILVDATLSVCIERAADIYRGQADVLADTWQEMNTATAALESIPIAWRQIFIPALPGMRGSIRELQPTVSVRRAKSKRLCDGG